MSAAARTTNRVGATVLAFVRLGRPQFLVGGFVMYGLGAAVAAQHRALDLSAYAWGQAAITVTQLMTHYANDYFDLAADRANETSTQWSGGSRVLANGELAPRVALRAAVVLGCVAFALDVEVGLRSASSVAVFPVLLAALALSWAYSAPPLRLHSRGLGALTVALVVTCLTPMAGFLLQSFGAVSSSALLVATVPLVCAQAAMILVIDFPDAAGDREAGKNTLAVRLGARAAANICAGVVCLPYVALPLLARAGLPMRAVVAVIATSPLAALLVHALARGDGERPTAWRRLTWLAVAWFALLAAGQLGAWVSLRVAP